MLNSRPTRRFWWIAAAVFSLIALLNYLPMFEGQVPFPRDHVLRHAAWDGQPRSTPPQQVGQLIDIVALFYPFRALLTRAAREHTLPLWNPYIMGGAPFEANAQSALFYPLHLLYYTLPLKVAWTANLTLRLILAGMFMTLFVRSIGGTDTGSIVAGIAFALSGFMVEFQGMSIAESDIWLPLMFYSIHRLYTDPGGRSVAIAGLSFALPVLAGHPETALHATFAVCLIVLWLWMKRFDMRFPLAFALAGFLALGLAAVQWIPTIEWVTQMPPQLENPQPVLDRHQGQGFFSRDIRRDPSSALVAIPEGASYVGMLALLGASLALFHESRRYTIFFAFIAALSVAVSFGMEPVRWVVVHIPVVKAIKNSRMILIADFALAAMAGLGISALEQRRVPVRRGLIVLGLAFLVLSFCVYEVHRATMTPVSFDRSPSASLIFLALGLIPLVLKLRGGLAAWRFPLVVVVVAGFEMITYSYGYLGFSPAAEVFPVPPVVEFLQTRGDPSTFRIARDRVPMPHDSGMIFGFEEADGYEIATERATMFTSNLTEDRPDGVMFQGEKILQAADRRFDMLNVKYLIAETPNPNAALYAQQRDRFVPVFSQGKVMVFENKTALPRAFVVPYSGIEVIADKDLQLARIKQSSFDPLRSVVVSRRPQGIAVDQGRHDDDRVDVVSRTMNEVLLRSQARNTSVAVLSQIYYPGWKATIDDAEIPVFPVDLALTGVIVPPGNHEIRLFFRPRSFQIGAGLSLASLIIFGVLAIRPKRFTTGHSDANTPSG